MGGLNASLHLETKIMKLENCHLFKLLPLLGQRWQIHEACCSELRKQQQYRNGMLFIFSLTTANFLKKINSLNLAKQINTIRMRSRNTVSYFLELLYYTKKLWESATKFCNLWRKILRKLRKNSKMLIEHSMRNSPFPGIFHFFLENL